MKNREILISSSGNLIEWFDFGLFILMAPIVGAKFFPQGSASTSTINALIVFTIGFLCRPLGGIFFGYFGDTQGRVKTLRISILIITISTLLIGLMPAYEEIGLTSSILFIILRLIQGLSIGGEYSGIMIYLAESAPNKKRGFITSFAAMGANLGFLFATLTFILLHSLFSTETINQWAWRVPFILIGIPGLLIVYYRFKLTETKVYSRLKRNAFISKMPLIEVIKFAPYQLIKILGLTCMSSTFYYFFIGNILAFLEHYGGFSLKTALTLQSLVLISMLFLVPLGGILGDSFSRKKMVLYTAIAILLFILPCFYLLTSMSIAGAVLALAIVTVLSSLDQGNTLPAIVENCPENVRYSGVSFSYNLGNALFGGTTPLITTLLIDNMGVMSPAFYLLFMACIGAITATTLLRNNQSMGTIGQTQHKLNSQNSPHSSPESLIANALSPEKN